MRFLVPLILLTAACPQEAGLQCPANTSLVGEYAFAFSARQDAGQDCTWRDDAGKTTPLALSDAGTKGATLCVGTAPDGGPQLNLLVAGKGGVRKSDLSPDGGFHFVSDSVVAQGTACVCDVTVQEAFDGFLVTSTPFALLPDGGLPAVNGVTASLVDALTLTSADCATSLRCNLPCAIVYNVNGAPF